MQKAYLQDKKHTVGKMHNYCDGSQFLSHPLFKTFPQALQILLYFDNLETTNPLSSKTKIHKMGFVYFALKKYSIIHHLLFNSMDREVYGFGNILEPRLERKFWYTSGIARIKPSTVWKQSVS